jgi:hypothetical protein
MCSFYPDPQDFARPVALYLCSGRARCCEAAWRRDRSGDAWRLLEHITGPPALSVHAWRLRITAAGMTVAAAVFAVVHLGETPRLR